MPITPRDVLNKNKNLNKTIDVDRIKLENITVEDLKYTGKNYERFINLKSLLESVSTCQISDAYNGIYKRSGTIKSIKPINSLKVWGSIYTAETKSDDWGTSALAIDSAGDGDVLFFKVDDDDKAIWGELASTCAKNNGIKGCVVYGSVRDLDGILDLDFPIFASNFVPNAGSPLGLGKLNGEIEVEDTTINPGDFLFGDENGIVIIPKELFGEVMVATLAVKRKESAIIDELSEDTTLAQVVGLR